MSKRILLAFPKVLVYNKPIMTANVMFLCKGGSHMRENRLFQIVYYLLDKGKATAPELAEKFEVSVRTVYRDLDALSASGIPLYTETGRNGGIYLMHDFALDQTLFSEEEKQEILTRLQSLDTLPNLRGNVALDKLSALFQSHSDDWLEVDFSRWGEKSQDTEKFEAIKSAILSKKAINITYASSNESFGERIVCPIKLVYKSKAWQLKAYCTKKCAYRTFKLTRILDWQILESEFSPEQLPELKASPQPDCKQVRLLLRFPKEAAYRVFDEFDREQISYRENSGLIVSARLPEDTQLTGYLLSFGTQVEILEPVYLRAKIAKEAQQIFEKNKP